MKFPEKFFWGAGTSSLQIEGYGHDGRGASIWDTFCGNGRCAQASPNIACDHINRYQEDIQLLKAIGVNSYRFSVSWPRVLPNGTGSVNPEGLDFYDRLVDALLEAGIIPHLTLFHWDYPQALQDRNGWMNPDSSNWFADYTEVIVNQLGDRVDHWYTLNEPACFTSLGLYENEHAPGLSLSFKEVLLATKHTMLAHGKACDVIRMNAKKLPYVGFSHVSPYFYPESLEEKYVKITNYELFTIYEKSVFLNVWWLDPMLKGIIPQKAIEIFEEDTPDFTEEELMTINQPIDFLGLNIYFGHQVTLDEDDNAKLVPKAEGAPTTHSGWPIQPELLYWAPRYMYERYQIPIIIAENGFSNLDWVFQDGRVHDPQRIDFMQQHLIQMQRALEDGIPIKGYFYWSLLDNFEWTEGFEKRFGLVHVDFQTQKRIIKDSGYWYRDMIKSKGETLTDNPFEERYGTYDPNPSN
jgi:beta-glucosidase